MVISSQLLSKLCPETPTHQPDSVLEIAEPYCFRHEYITIDDFFITDCESKQGGSELDSCTDSKDKVFTVG